MHVYHLIVRLSLALHLSEAGVTRSKLTERCTKIAAKLLAQLDASINLWLIVLLRACGNGRWDFARCGLLLLDNCRKTSVELLGSV